LKKPTAASARRLTEANLVALGAEHLAGLLLELAASQPALKRRLRMELAAAVGPAELAQEIDKRLATLQASKARVSWRKRAEFLTDLDVVRAMIAETLADLDPAMAFERMLAFLALARPLSLRVKDPKGEMDAVFEQAADDLGALLGRPGVVDRAPALVAAILKDARRWSGWIGRLGDLDARTAEAILQGLAVTEGRVVAEPRIIRWLADKTGKVDLFIASFTPASRTDPATGAAIATRLPAAGRVKEAAAALDRSDPRKSPARRAFPWKGAVVDALDANPEWEAAQIAVLEVSDPDAAQTARWASFERTLSAERLRDIVSRLADFDDVEAMDKAFAHAARDVDMMRGLGFLMDWPALPEAARMIAARADELKGPSSLLEGWAGRLRARQPTAARTLLLAAAKAATREGRSLDEVEALRIEAAEIET
jgi:hypothetical protein